MRAILVCCLALRIVVTPAIKIKAKAKDLWVDTELEGAYHPTGKNATIDNNFESMPSELGTDRVMQDVPHMNQVVSFRENHANTSNLGANTTLGANTSKLVGNTQIQRLPGTRVRINVGGSGTGQHAEQTSLAQGTSTDNNLENEQSEFGEEFQVMGPETKENHTNASDGLPGAQVRFNVWGSGRFVKNQHLEQASLMMGSLAGGKREQHQSDRRTLQKHHKDQRSPDDAPDQHAKKALLADNSTGDRPHYHDSKAALPERNSSLKNAQQAPQADQHEPHIKDFSSSLLDAYKSGRLAEEPGLVQSLMGYLMLGIVLLGAYLYAKRIKLFTKYREFFPSIAEFMLQFGLDKHAAFEIEVMVHEVVLEGYNDATRIELCARENVESTPIGTLGKSKRVAGASVTIFECVLKVEVPQGTTKILLKMCDSGKDSLAELKWDVDQVLGLSDPEKAEEDAEHTFDMKLSTKGRKKLKKDPKVIVSMGLDHESHELLASTNPGTISPPTKQAKVNLLEGIPVDKLSKSLGSMLKKAAAKKVKDLDPDKELSFKDIANLQLSLMAELARGDLCATQGFWGDQQIRKYALQCGTDANGKKSLSTWRLGWWKTLDDLKKDREPEGSILVLSICRIFPAKNNLDDFAIVYVVPGPEDAENTLSLSCVDLPRDVWVESLQAFIVQLRTIRHKVAEEKSSGSTGQKSEKSAKKKDDGETGDVGGKTKEIKKSFRDAKKKDHGETGDVGGTGESSHTPRKHGSHSSQHGHDSSHDDSHVDSEPHKKQPSKHGSSKAKKSQSSRPQSSDSEEEKEKKHTKSKSKSSGKH